jgi:hypothetical protein
MTVRLSAGYPTVDHVVRHGRRDNAHLANECDGVNDFSFVTLPD